MEPRLSHTATKCVNNESSRKETGIFIKLINRNRIRIFCGFYKIQFQERFQIVILCGIACYVPISTDASAHRT